MNAQGIGLRIIITLLVLTSLLNLPAPAFSQQTANIQNLVRNGNFEDEFPADRGVAPEWHSFNNSGALIGWQAETWSPAVPERQQAQMIELKNATERDRYAGIYQTIHVVPDQQYRLTLKGLIRSTEGDISLSNYGYRLQYAVDYQGGTAWELLSDDAWQELPWDEQPLTEPVGGIYRIETFNTTLTSQGENLTLFIRGWKKWIDKGSGVYDLDDISLVGPIPDAFEPPVTQKTVALTQILDPAEAEESKSQDTSPQAATNQKQSNLQAQAEESSTPSEAGASSLPDNPAPLPQVETQQQLPISGQGQDDTINYVMISGAVFLLLLFISAAIGARRKRHHSIK